MTPYLQGLVMAITIIRNETRREVADAGATLLSALRDELGVRGWPASPAPGVQR
jgi:hypothetical protein